MYIPTLMARNSLDVNPPLGVTAHLSVNGSSWLWAVTAVYGVSLICFMAWAIGVKRKYEGDAVTGPAHACTACEGGMGAHTCSSVNDSMKKYHNIAILIISIGTVAYFLMASDLGYTGIATEFSHHVPKGTSRQIFYVRWVYYALSMPLYTVMFTLVARAQIADMLLATCMAASWPIALLIGGLIRTSYKWGLFVLAVIFYLYQMYLLAGPCRRSSLPYLSGLGAFALFGVLYFIAWGCAEGGNVISTTSEMVWYGVIDVLFKPFFLIFFLLVVREEVRKQDKTRNLGAAETGLATTISGATATHHTSSPRMGKKMFDRFGHHDAPVSEKPATGMAATEATAPTGETDMGAGQMGQANPRFSEATAVGETHH
ncbi:hypothetical protein CspHIS471_0606680 [Cutaneotrichosporon sp. HIS471]|nr:hypothetical protein CspHIS471_0606680 [Cutaneotrichosporon sp. HIS471]